MSNLARDLTVNVYSVVQNYPLHLTCVNTPAGNGATDEIVTKRITQFMTKTICLE